MPIYISNLYLYLFCFRRTRKYILKIDSKKIKSTHAIKNDSVSKTSKQETS